MEQFYLEKPSISRKIDVLEYMEEHQKYQSDINGAGSFDKVLDGVTYEDCLEKDFKMENKEYANSINKCPRKTFFLIRKHDNKLIGMISIRYDLTEELLQFVGHIGYGIRPTERGKGYNKIRGIAMEWTRRDTHEETACGTAGCRAADGAGIRR